MSRVHSIARGLAMMLVPGGRARLQAETRIDEFRNRAVAIGVSAARADAMAAYYRLSIRLGLISESELRRRLCVAAIAEASRSAENAASAMRACIENYSHYVVTAQDQAVYDAHPDRCWRCDAVEADGDLGLCTSCRRDLTKK